MNPRTVMCGRPVRYSSIDVTLEHVQARGDPAALCYADGNAAKGDESLFYLSDGSYVRRERRTRGPRWARWYRGEAAGRAVLGDGHNSRGLYVRHARGDRRCSRTPEPQTLAQSMRVLTAHRSAIM